MAQEEAEPSISDAPEASSHGDASAVTQEIPVQPPALLGEHSLMQAVRQQLALLAASRNTTALILGETGTGKELAARTIHALSSRAAHRFVAINCTAIPAELFESELFGHEQGAFSGATESRPGVLELAGAGTILLDEVATLPVALQLKLLRILDTGEYRRLGGVESLHLDARVLAATNADLEHALRKGRLRPGLLYRLAVFSIEMPPLRAHASDIPLYCDHFLRDLSRGLHRPARGLTPKALDLLAAYAFPGNVRELRNLLARVAISSDTEWITAEQFAEVLRPPATSADVERIAASRLERSVLDGALTTSGGNKSHAAAALGISRYALLRRLRSTESHR